MNCLLITSHISSLNIVEVVNFVCINFVSDLYACSILFSLRNSYNIFYSLLLCCLLNLYRLLGNNFVILHAFNSV